MTIRSLEQSQRAIQSEADWRISRDPVAMLLWLASLHPAPHVEACMAVGEHLASLPATSFLAREQRDWLEGRRMNGPSLFHFQMLASLMRGALRREAVAGDPSVLAGQIADALRSALQPDALRVEHERRTGSSVR